MPYEIPQMSLKQATLAQGSFTPTIFTPQTPDVNILQKSLAQIEARHNAAIEQSAKFNEVATKLETMVNPAEQAWVKDYIDRQSQEFNALIASGDYGAATRMAMLAGSNLLKNPEAIGRIKNQEAYKEFTDRIIKDNDISSLSKERALSQNAYGKTEDITDNNGNIIGVKEWKPLYTPVKSKSVTNLAVLASKIIAPYEYTTGGTSTVNDDLGKHFEPTGNKELDEDLKYYYQTSHTEGGHYSVKRLDEKTLRVVFEALYSADTEAMQSLMQDYDDINWKLQQLENQLKSETDLAKRQDIQNKIEQYSKGFYNKNHINMTPEQYMLTRINPLLASMAYETITDINNYSDTYSNKTPEITGADDLPENSEGDTTDTGSGNGAPLIVGGNPPQAQSALELVSPWRKRK